jgi:hypothetical protein
MGPIWAKLLDHLMQNGRALRDAPLVFVAVIILAFGLSFWINGLRYEGVLAQKDGAIEGLKTQVSGLQQQLANRPQGSPSATAPIRDPDGVYQLGVKVGSVQSPQVDEAKGMVIFDAIIDAVKLNADHDFEYRDFVLHIRNLRGFANSTIAGQKGRSLSTVMCEIVGRVSHQ